MFCIQIVPGGDDNLALSSRFTFMTNVKREVITHFRGMYDQINAMKISTKTRNCMRTYLILFTDQPSTTIDYAEIYHCHFQIH